MCWFLLFFIYIFIWLTCQLFLIFNNICTKSDTLKSSKSLEQKAELPSCVIIHTELIKNLSTNVYLYLSWNKTEWRRDTLDWSRQIKTKQSFSLLLYRGGRYHHWQRTTYHSQSRASQPFAILKTCQTLPIDKCA